MENQLIPIEVKKRPSVFRFIKNGVSFAALSLSEKGLKKLSPEDTKFLASIINTAVANYNEKNGQRLNERDLERIQKRLSKLEVFTFEEERKLSEKRIAKKEKKLGRKINTPKARGYLFTLTNALVISKKEWEKYKESGDAKAFIKLVAHEGYHYLTNEVESTFGFDRVIAEGTDESFIVKAYDDGKFSTVKADGKGNGLVHYNFYSNTRYSPAVSILNMLGIMLNVNPELTELNGTKAFVKAIKQHYGEDFYKQLIKRTDIYLSPDKYEKMRNEVFYTKLIQNFVVRTITNDIVENVKSPEDAVRRLRALQRAEEWNGRILFRRKGEDPNKSVYEPDNSFEFYYRRTYVRVIEKLKEKGYIDLDEVEACKYKKVKFRPLRRIDIENKPGGTDKFVKRIDEAKIFYKYFYKETDIKNIFEPQQINLYRRYKKLPNQERPQIKYQPPGPIQQVQQQRQQNKLTQQKQTTPKKKEDDNEISFGEF